MRRQLLTIAFVTATLIAMTATSLAQEPIPFADHPAHDYHPKWSPDGQSILFTSQRGGRISIWCQDFPEGGPIEIATGLEGDHHISWSPNGREIVFDARLESGPLTLWIIDTHGGQPKRVEGVGTGTGHPCWSPDGRSIAFAAAAHPYSHIWMVSLETHQATQLTFGPHEEHHPIWTPDGKEILFASDRNGDYDIWSVDVASKQLTCLYEAPGRQDLATPSPDGSLIAFVDMNMPGRAIRILNCATGEAPIWKQGSQVSWPSWSPDGTWIAYVAANGSNLDIWVDAAP